MLTKLTPNRIGALATLCFTVTLTAAEPEKPPNQPTHSIHDQYTAQVLSLKPVGYWPLNEISGTVAHDMTAHHRNGTYHGPVKLHDKGPMPGGFGVGFDARKKTYVEIANNSDFSQPTHDGLTVEVWMKPDALTFPGETNEPYIYWLGKGEKDHMEWGFRFYSRETYRPNWTSAYIWNPTGPNGNEGAGAHMETAPTVGEWRHIVATYDPGAKANPKAGVLLYVNGVRQQGPPASATLYQTYQFEPRTGPAPVRIGTRDLNSFFTGALSDVAIYPRVLTAAEIKENYRVATAIRTGSGPQSAGPRR